MELFLTNTGRINFTQMARCSKSCESRFRQNFKKPFDWLGFNTCFLDTTKKHRIAIAIDPCYKLYTADLWAVSLEREVRVVVVDYIASLTSVNLAKAFARQQGLNLSVGATKVLLHNAAMVDRIFAMSGTHPNLHLTNTNFKELLFYGVRAVG